MCGISGAVVRTARAKVIALAISAQLERRGYDNAGLAVLVRGLFCLRKVVGATTELRPVAAEMPESCVSIGHTRWATTGAVVENNAHPFRVDKVVLAGNGDITNHAALRVGLRPTTLLTSEVDTEVGAALISEIYNDLVGISDVQTRLVMAVRNALPRLEGSFALVIGVDDWEGLVVLRHGVNTAFVGQLPDGEGFCLSSDEESLLEFTKEFHRLNDGDFAVITKESVTFLQGESFVSRAVSVSEHQAGAASKGEFDSFLEKEIKEQPSCIRRLVSNGIPACPDFTQIKRAVILACGSARYAGKVGQYLLESAGLPTRVFVASEFAEWPQLGDGQTLVVAVSQSGTTADVLEAVNHARELEFGPLVVITNTVSSPLAVMADLILPILSGPEISVASTKAVTSMAAVFALLVGCLNQDQPAHLREVANLMEATLTSKRIHAQVDSAARFLAGSINKPPMLVLGQGISHVAAREVALKIKELTGLPTESFPSRELKHGPIAMISAGTPAVFCAVGLTEDTVIEQVKARGAFTIGIIEQGSPLADRFDLVIATPAATFPLAQFVANLVPGQLLSLELALLLDKNVDRPANLAKSATTK
jgi:glutamine---fructose-6-phosphate transaminase (isomerizing)